MENTPNGDPLSNSFRCVPSSAVHMAERIRRCYLNISHSILELDVLESNKFDVLDWVAGLKDAEILTLMSLDSKDRILCMLRFMQLSLIDHETTFDAQEPPGRLCHKIHLKFEVMERVENPIIGGK